MAHNGFIPSDEQARALDAIQTWYDDPWSGTYSRESGVFRLFGYAGTGKTTLVKHAVSRLGFESKSVSEMNDAAKNARNDAWSAYEASGFDGGLEDYIEEYRSEMSSPFACFGAYTGKAAHMLRRKGIPEADTLHSLIYLPVDQSRIALATMESELHTLETELEKRAHGTVTGLREAIAKLKRDIRNERERLREPDFILNKESALRHASLLVIDEVSMVNEEMASHLLSFGVPILVLGDPAQLPPVRGGGYFTETTPDAMLVQVHRHALESPIGRFAMSARTSNGDRFCGIHGFDAGSGRVAELTLDHMIGCDVTLCWKKVTRHELNASIRAALDRPIGIPVMNDVIMIMHNNRKLNIFNGQIFTVLGAWPLDDHSFGGRMWSMAVENEDGELRMLNAVGWGFEGFEGEERMADISFKRCEGIVRPTFANAITVHKAQGSEWDRVAILDQTPNIYGTKLHSGATRAEASRETARWMYTAVTRAASQVLISRQWK